MDDKKMADLYIDFLLASSGQCSATNLANLLDNTISHDKITRFLANADLNNKKLWKTVKPIIRKIESQAQQTDAVLVIDDTIIEKPHALENDIISWFYSSMHHKTVKGINLVTLLYHTPQITLPISIGVLNKSENISKHKLFQQFFKKAVENQVKFDWVVGDSWYSSKENMDFIHKLGRKFIFPIHENRNIALSESEKEAKIWFKAEEILSETTRSKVWLEGLDFPLYLHKLIYAPKEGTEVAPAVSYLLSNEAEDHEKICELYQRRWQIEIYHKSIKNNSSMGSSPVQRVLSQINHFYLSVIGYIQMERLRIETSLNHFRIKQKLYLFSLKNAFQQLQLLKKHYLA